MQRQFTATVYILHEAKTLLIYHKKHNIWVPPGGHVEANETPAETAKREAFEETGCTIEFIKQENVWFDSFANAKSIERPYLMLLESIPATAKEPAHEHIDFIYLARLVSQQPPQEAHTMRWFTLEEVQSLKSGEEIFPDGQKTITHIFQTELLHIWKKQFL